MSRFLVVQGDARALPFADGSAHCCVTSPPYFGLRDYGVAGQLGLEKTPEEYVAGMVQVFREVWRVLRDDGTLWLNIGDSYNSIGHKKSNSGYGTTGLAGGKAQEHTPLRREAGWRGAKHKDLIGIPWMLAFALRADGWYLRSDIIWSKPNPMPESVTDRPTKAHEYLFLLSKSQRYYYDAAAIAEPSIYAGDVKKNLGATKDFDPVRQATLLRGERTVPPFRNKRSVWTVTTKPFKGAHFATFPPALIEPCILAGTSEHGCCAKCGAPWERVTEVSRTFESGSGKSGNMPIGKNGAGLQGGGETGDIRRGPVVHSTTVGWEPSCDCNAERTACTVLDPFTGSGTTGEVAIRHGRNFVGTELNADYVAMARKRIGKSQSLSSLLGI